VWIDDGRLWFDYNAFGDHSAVGSDRPVPVGDTVVGVQFRRDGRGGHAQLVIDGEPCGGVDIPFVMHIISSLGLSVGRDHGSPVTDRYRGPFPFTGRFDRLDIQLVSERANSSADARAGMGGQ
jgi:arylsulfatase